MGREELRDYCLLNKCHMGMIWFVGIKTEVIFKEVVKDKIKTALQGFSMCKEYYKKEFRDGWRIGRKVDESGCHCRAQMEGNNWFS